MKSSLKIVGLVLLSCAIFSQSFAQMQVERLNRGLISVRVGSNNYLSWRLLASDPYNVGFNIYRGTTKVNSTPIAPAANGTGGATNYTDNGAAANSVYTVRAVVNGVEQAASEQARIISNMQGNNAGYIQVGLQRPGTGSQGGTYAPGDASVGDLDGDGEYEIVLKWDPSNAKDNAQDGITDNVLIDAYKLNGTRMWRIDLGPNIRAGAHYTQFMVYDFDGDGKAEIMMKTAEGTRQGTNSNTAGAYISKGPAATGSHSSVRRNATGYILTGAEYLTVFNGETGAEMATISYNPPRGTVSDWGDSKGNRVDRFNAAVAYLDGQRPSAVFQRGYYTRLTLWAVDWRNGQLTQRWFFDSGYCAWQSAGCLRGMGNHQLSVADVDNDGDHDIITGSGVVDNTGKVNHSTGGDHGDALHVAHMIKGHPTPQIFMPHECCNGGVLLRHANNGATIFHHRKDADVGRACAAELQAGRGFVFWAASGMGLYNISGQSAGSVPSSINHVVWWDGELSRELLNGNTVTKWSVQNNSGTNLLTATGYSSVNGTKSNPVLQADIFGDWREEVILSNGTNALRIYTTTMPTTHRLVTMMHDPTYRVAIAWQNVSYNQPPHPGYYIASDMNFPPPKLNVAVVGGSNTPIMLPAVKPAVSPAAATASVNGRVLDVSSPNNETLVISVIDVRGKVRARFDVNGNGKLSLAKIPAGRYFVDVKGAGVRQTLPVIIK